MQLLIVTSPNNAAAAEAVPWSVLWAGPAEAAGSQNH
jgi:hypothetical protein